MRILTASETRALDRYTIEHEPIASIDLMERASERFTEALLERYPDQYEFHILAGMGNNGGDGLAVARLLSNKGKLVMVSLLKHSHFGSENFQTNLKRLDQSRNVDVSEIVEADQLRRSDQVLVIDAILGSGLTRPLEGFLKEVVAEANSWPNKKVSIDIPTGLFSEDNSSNRLESVLRCDHCITFHAPKLSFLIADNADVIPSFEVADIELSRAGESLVSESKNHLLVADEVGRILKDRTKFSHKGTYGRALLLAGSKGKAGAAILAGEACLRSGAGLLTMQVPKVNLSPTQSALPEAMCLVDEHKNELTTAPGVDGFTAVGIGPGIGTSGATAEMLTQLLYDSIQPVVLDADALNIISEQQHLLSTIPKNSILTPHPKEFDRLFGESGSAYERLTVQKKRAEELGLIIIVKGAHTSIALPNGETFFNSTGNPGMATAGSGDVLTGVLLGLLAQRYDPDDAAKLGVFIHGVAGDLAAEEIGQDGLIASDLIRKLPEAFKRLRAVTRSS